ncbi:MAG TPA: tRNA uridine-5-carboxymethylaminomethyl(34) synthesis GTPase MnmE [Oligoflexia bacterium]|nr:tRNA uridine-5-carboxymethylaminomethyl(34) synthesis GTPase MnmE [Oligoflexia bacterium]HMP26782.1 tRNA uridine-5-carboxymethylaminomethyl(34) synthesis GTPase MnmE [Oligoflexia bacterium]
MTGVTFQTTIAALATAPHPAGIAIIRVSGPESKMALREIFRSLKDPIEHPRMMVVGEILDFGSKQIIDTAIAVFMPQPNSFTGEDVVEFQFHGSPLLVTKILRSLYAYGITPAQPGEFSKRAFLSGKLDLAQAEAIADLINATSESALYLASQQLKGRFSKIVSDLGEPLRDALAEIEASIDFPEEDIEPNKLEQIADSLGKTNHELAKLINSYALGIVVKEGYRVLFCGPPNVGKSSLMNLLLGNSRVIVTEEPGTTRDIIEEQANIEGFHFIFCDSAGIRETENKVEKIGIELAIDKIALADLVLLVVDADDNVKSWESVLPYLKEKAKKVWLVVNKIDLNQAAIGAITCDLKVCEQSFYISAKEKSGIEILTSALVEEVKRGVNISAEANHILTNERHRDCLSEAKIGVEHALKAIADNLPIEIVSAEIRSALRSLEELIGRTYDEDILGKIFSKFCIGK